MTNPPLVTPEIRARAIAERRARDRQRREAPPEPARENPYACYRTTPVLFAVERLHVEERTLIWGANGVAYEHHTWDGTEEPIAAMLEGIADGLDVAVSSGTGLGKSFGLAVLSMWFLACWENSLVFSFAPKEDQLRLFSWSEMRQLMPAFREMFPEATLTDLCLRVRGGQDDSWSAHGYPVGVSAADKKTSGGVATKAQGMHCLSDDHEILTRRGWLGMDRVTTDDVVLSVGDTGNAPDAEWMPVTAVHRYETTEPLTVYDGQSVSFAVTSEHRFPTKYADRPKRWKLKPLSDLAGQFMVRRRSGWDGTTPPVPAPFARLGFDAPRFAELLGFWCGDGGVTKYNQFLLYQTKPEGKAYVERLLAGVQWDYVQDAYAVTDKACAAWLRDNVGTFQVSRTLPQEWCDAPCPLLDRLLEGLWRSDGTFANGKRRSFYSTSKRLIDQVQEMLIKIGRPATVGINRLEGTVTSAPQGYPIVSRRPCYTIRWQDRPSDHIVRRENLRLEHGTGRVWCISTPHQTFYTRRRGRVFLSGNSAHMLLLYEEGPGIPQAVLEAGENTCTAPHNLRAIVGNPTSKLDTLYTFAHDFRGRVRPGVKAIRMSAHDHPNIVCRDASIVPGAASVESVRRRAGKYGTDHILYKSRIQGIAPSDAKDSLIKLEWIRRAQVRWAEPDSRRVLEAVGKGRRSMGVDVANSEGGDDGARARGKGAVLLEVEAAPCPNANELGFQVHLEMEREHIEAQHVGVDDVGVGAGCVNELRRLKHVIRELGGGDAPDGSDGVEQFVNLRGQMLWELAEDFRFDRIAIPPDDDELVADLVLYTYETRGSKIWVHPKEEMKEILGRSPNKGDAVMMWNHVRPRDIVADKVPSAEKGKTLTLEQQVYRDIQSLGKPKRSRYTPWTG